MTTEPKFIETTDDAGRVVKVEVVHEKVEKKKKKKKEEE